MKLLGAFSKKIRNMKLIAVIMCIVISMCNMSVPYYMSSRNQAVLAADKFQKLLAKYPYDLIIKSGKLTVKDWGMKSDGGYSVGFLMQPSEMSTENYMNMRQEQMDFSLDGKMVTLAYKDSEDVTLEELQGAIGTSVLNIAEISIFGAVLLGIVELLLILCCYLMVSFFLLKKEVKYRVLIRYTGVSLAAASFVSGFAALTMTSKLTVILICFTFISAVLNMFLILPEYNRVKSEEYL